VADLGHPNHRGKAARLDGPQQNGRHTVEVLKQIWRRKAVEAEQNLHQRFRPDAPSFLRSRLRTRHEGGAETANVARLPPA